MSQSGDANDNNIIEPVVVLTASFQYDSGLRMALALARPINLDVDIRPVVGPELIPCIGSECSVGISHAPFGTYIENLSFGRC